MRFKRTEISPTYSGVFGDKEHGFDLYCVGKGSQTERSADATIIGVSNPVKIQIHWQIFWREVIYNFGVDYAKRQLLLFQSCTNTCQKSSIPI